MSLFTKTLGLSAPILQSPMAGSQDHRLAAAVSNAGGLGALPAATLTSQQLENELKALQAATSNPFNVNFFCHPTPVENPHRLKRWHEALADYYLEMGLDPAHIPSGVGRTPFSPESADVLEAFRPAVVSFHFGLPSDSLVQRIQSWGSIIWSSATTVAEAQWLEARGVDAIIAQGLEAGGHRGMFLTEDVNTQTGTFALLPQIAHAVRVPVIAAGGIANATGVIAAKVLGASAVQVGTAYLCSNEATTSPLHRAALQSPAVQHTALTNLFSGRPARGIMNRLMQELGPLSAQAPAFPLATAGIAPLRAAAEALGRTDFTPLWSGQNARDIRTGPASDITRDLIQGWLTA